MRTERAEVLLVEQDVELADTIAECVERSLRAHVARVGTADEAVAACAAKTPDVVIAEMQLPDCDGLSLARTLRNHLELDSSVILLSEQPTVGRAVEAMRLGVRDLFTKPFDMARLCHVVGHEMEEQRQRQRVERRHIRLRRMVSRIVRERRDLRERIDLICRDVVTAYHRLAQKVTAQQPMECDE